MEQIPAEIGDRIEFTEDVLPSSGEPLTLPISLRLIAYGFVFLGAMSLFEIVYLWFRDGNIFWNFNAILLFVGWGLFRLKPLAQGCASVFVWMCIAGLSVGLVLVWLMSGEDVSMSFAGRPIVEQGFVGRLLVSILVLFVLGLLLWIHKVLSSKAVNELFLARSLQKDRTVRKTAFRFSIGNLMFLTALVAFMAARIGMDSRLQNMWMSVSGENGMSVGLHLGLSRRIVTRESEPSIAYLVIAHENSGVGVTNSS